MRPASSRAIKKAPQITIGATSWACRNSDIATIAAWASAEGFRPALQCVQISSPSAATSAIIPALIVTINGSLDALRAGSRRTKTTAAIALATRRAADTEGQIAEASAAGPGQT